ncbi:MAG: hypothetical protein HYX94_10440 [Chloroflexi bacterium]|nr:hypothetical protein [Chloroflexota bacterium]
MAAERAGVRSATIVATNFLAQAKAIGRTQGFKSLPLAEYPGVDPFDSTEVFVEKIGNVVVDQIVEGLASQIELAPAAAAPKPRDVVFAGDFDAVQDHFEQNLWSDGLPIAPPTIERVEEFLRFTDRSPDEVIGELLPERREATVWSVAVNGVMAGCRPEYMPILLGMAEVMVEPMWRIEDGGSTPGWEPLAIVNGPIVKDLNFNYGTGAMRVGRRANSSIGRFARLYMRNIAGLLPGTTDKGTLAYTFNVALAEDEDAVAKVGWRPFSVERGFAPGESVVTVQSVVGISPPIYVAGGAAEIAQKIVESWGEGNVKLWAYTGIMFHQWHPLLVLSPCIAEVFAKEGWSKDDLKRYLYENTKMPAWHAERGPRLRPQLIPGYSTQNLCKLVEAGELPKEYCLSSDPERLVPVFFRSETIGIVVAGDTGKNQCKGYTQNAKQGVPLSKLIKLPVRWEELLSEARDRRANGRNQYATPSSRGVSSQ